MMQSHTWGTVCPLPVLYDVPVSIENCHYYRVRKYFHGQNFAFWPATDKVMRGKVRGIKVENTRQDTLDLIFTGK